MFAPFLVAQPCLVHWTTTIATLLLNPSSPPFSPFAFPHSPSPHPCPCQFADDGMFPDPPEMQEFAQELGPMLGAFPSASLGSASPGSTLPLLRDAEMVVQECMDRVLLSSQWGRKLAGLEPSFTVIVDSFERRVEEAEAVVDAEIKAFVSSAITSLLKKCDLLPQQLSTAPHKGKAEDKAKERGMAKDGFLKSERKGDSEQALSVQQQQQEQVQQNRQQQQVKEERGLSEAGSSLSTRPAASTASTTLPGDTVTPTVPDTITSQTTDTVTSAPPDTVTSAHSSTAIDNSTPSTTTVIAATAAPPTASPASETPLTGTRSTVTAAGGKGGKVKGRGSGSKEGSKEGHALEGDLLAGLLRLMGEDGAADLLYKAMGIGRTSGGGVGGKEGGGNGKRRMGEDEASELLGKAMAFLNRDGDDAGRKSGGDVGGKSGSDAGGESGSVTAKNGNDKSTDSVDEGNGKSKDDKAQSFGSHDGGDTGLSGIVGKDKALIGSGTGANSSGGMSPVDSSIDKTATSSLGSNVSSSSSSISSSSASSSSSTVTANVSDNADLSMREGIKGAVEKKQEDVKEIAAEEKHLVQRGLGSTPKTADEDPAQESIRQVVSAIRGKLAAAVAEGTRGMAGLVDSAKEAVARLARQEGPVVLPDVEVAAAAAAATAAAAAAEAAAQAAAEAALAGVKEAIAIASRDFEETVRRGGVPDASRDPLFIADIGEDREEAGWGDRSEFGLKHAG
ncbi:unnamed protein product [Closterium sp. Naga37s-1]|nr:unnamed protein product [Closterium sp. Naga37s-1]